MKNFPINVVAIDYIESIANYNNIEVAVIGNNQAVVRKGKFKPGDLGVLIGDRSYVSDRVANYFNITNRVRSIKIGNIISDGIFVSIDDINQIIGYTKVQLGDDVSQLVAITKQMQPNQFTYHCEKRNALDYQCRKYTEDTFAKTDKIVITERFAGPTIIVGLLPDHERSSHHFFGKFVVSTTGMSERLLSFTDHRCNANNQIIKDLIENQIFGKLETFVSFLNSENVGVDQPIYFVGSIVDNQFYLADLAVGYRQSCQFYDFFDVNQVADILELNVPPVLYSGQNDRNLIDQHSKRGILIRNFETDQQRKCAFYLPTLKN